MARFNATVSAWKRDNESESGTINATTGRFVPGSVKTYYLEDEPCLLQGFSRTEMRDITEFAAANDPARISLDKVSSTFAIGDRVSVSYRDVIGRVAEIRSISWNPRGRRQTVMVIEFLAAE